MNLPVFTVKKGELATMMELKRAVDNIISDKKVNLYRVLSYWHAKELVSERGIFWSHTTNNVPISTLKTRVPVYDLTFPELAEHKLNCPSFLGFDHGDHLDLTLSGAQTFIFLIKYAYAKHNPDESIYLANVAVALAILLLNHDYEMFPLPASFTRMVILAHIRNKADWSTWPEMKAYIDVASNQLDSLLYCLRLDRRYYTGSDNLFNQQDLDQLWLGLLSSITPCVLYNNTIPDGSEQEKDHLWFYRHHESLINAELQSLRFDHGTDDDVDLDALRQQHQNAVYAPDHASNEEDESQASISDRHVDFVAEAQLNADSEHTLPSFVERNGVKAMRGSGHVPAFVLTREVKTDLDLEDLDVGLKLAEKVYPDDQKVTETSSVKDMHLRDDFPSWTKEIFAQQCRSVKPYVAQMVARFNAISRPTAIALARNREELSRFVLSSVDLIRDAHTTRRPVLLEVETAATPPGRRTPPARRPPRPPSTL